ncbi:MAG: DUF4091 domain-containing protein [Clostridia bacterium]|nr:DUF4091 domain-containing protein [Clostridia bacterium]
MKKIIAFILLLCMAFSFASCGGGDGKPTGNGGNNGAVTVKAWAFHSFEKTVVNVAPKGNFKTDYTVYLAKGETEGCQVAVYSENEIKNVSLVLKSGETELIKPAMFSMNKTQKVVKKQYTDALIPYYGRRLNIERRTILPFMIEFTTDENTPAGDYEYVYELVDKEKNVLATYNITVHVWDFEIPKEKTFETAVGLQSTFIHYYKGNPVEWYETLLDHNMSAYEVPYDILDPRADAYMSDPRVTSFRVPVPTLEAEDLDGDKYLDTFVIDEKKLLEYCKKVKSDPVWLEKAYFYPYDEPHTKEQLSLLKEIERQLTKLCPEIEIMAPYYTNIQMSENSDQTDFMETFTDLWCPKLCLWDDAESYGEFLTYTPSKTFEERMNDQIAKGDRMWCYVCNDPNNPYAQLFLDTDGAVQRLMFWQIYQRDIEGFLYWSACWYRNNNPWDEGGSGKLVCEDPWESATSITDGDGHPVYGEGWILYPGVQVGYGGACPSIRAKIVRDGIDEIEMFYLAEKYLDKEWIVAKTKEGTPTLTEYVSGDKYVALRIEIGNALEAAMKK